MKRKPANLSEVDVDLEQAIAEFRNACDRLDHGRVHLTVDRYDGLTIGHYLSRDHLTTEDIARLMVERPHKEATCR